MSTHDIGADLSITPSLVPTARTAGTHDGDSVDRMPAGQDGFTSGVMQVCSGSPDAGTFTLNATLQESDDDSNFTDVLDEDGNAVVITEITAADTQQTVNFRAKSLGKYLRVEGVTTNAGGGTTVEYGANIVLGGRLKR